MKRITTLIGLATLGISSANAGVYMGADIGYSKIHTGNLNYALSRKGAPISNGAGVFNSSNKNKDLESIKFGYSFSDGLRTEVSLTRYGNVNNNYGLDLKKEDKPDDTYPININRSIKANTLMANVYYDFNKDGNLQPYVMAGMGLGMNKTELKEAKYGKESNTKNYFAYQAGVGAAYKINNHVYADAGVKYAHLGKAATNSVVLSQSAKMSSIDATIGIRYEF